MKHNGILMHPQSNTIPIDGCVRVVKELPIFLHSKRVRHFCEYNKNVHAVCENAGMKFWLRSAIQCPLSALHMRTV